MFDTYMYIVQIFVTLVANAWFMCVQRLTWKWIESEIGIIKTSSAIFSINIWHTHIAKILSYWNTIKFPSIPTCISTTSILYKHRFICMVLYTVYIYAKQKHLGCKKVWGQSEATLQTGRCDRKVWYQLRPRSYFIKYSNSLNDIAY